MGSTATQSNFWPLLFASFGGFVVVLGLALELLAEKKWFKNFRSMRFWNSAKTWGERLVIIGIIFEIADAGWTEYEIKKNDPMNQPVRSLSAILYFTVVGTNFDRGMINLEPNGSWSWSHNAQHNASGELEVFNRHTAAMLGCDSFEMHPLFLSNGTNFFHTQSDFRGRRLLHTSRSLRHRQWLATPHFWFSNNHRQLG
jgi:hypothetical protein